MKMISQEYKVAVKVFHFQNHTFIGKILESHNHTTATDQEPYDSTGAMYYILAVIFMYSCSILMIMIGSFMKKSKHDNHIRHYMKDVEMVRRLELKQEKFRTKLQMHQKKVITMFCYI